MGQTDARIHVGNRGRWTRGSVSGTQAGGRQVQTPCGGSPRGPLLGSVRRAMWGLKEYSSMCAVDEAQAGCPGLTPTRVPSED